MRKEDIMATVTLKYDARNTIFKQLIQLFISLGGEVETKEKNTVSPEAREIAKRYSDVKSGKVKTRPISALFDEL